MTRNEKFNLVLIFLAYLLCASAVLISGCGPQKEEITYHQGEVVYHQLEGMRCLVLYGPVHEKYGTYYIVRYKNDVGLLQIMTVEEHEIKREYCWE